MKNQNDVITNVLEAKSGRSQPPKLWESFLNKTKMRNKELYHLSNFKAQSIHGFYDFLRYNNIAQQIGDTFILSGNVIPQIRKVLDQGIIN